MKLTKIKQFLGLFLAIFLGFSGTVTLVLPHHALAANFILGDGSPGSISNGDNTQFVFVDPFTIRGPGGTIYTTASDACNNDNMFLCSGYGATFHSHNYWYWPQGTNISDSGFFPATNGQCVSALVLGVPVSGKGLRNAHLSVVNSENSAGGCHVLDNSKKTIAGKDILGWGAWARDDRNVGDTYNNTGGNGTPQVLSSDVAAADISKSNTSDRAMYLAFGTVFKWVNRGEIDSIPKGVQSTAATDTSTAAYKDIVSGLQQASGSTKNYASSDYTYFFPNACIDSGSGKIKAFLAVNKNDSSQLTVLHRIDGDTSKAFIDDWYGAQSNCLWGGQDLQNSPTRIWSDSNQNDGTIGVGDLANTAKASSSTGAGGSLQPGSGDSTDALDCGGEALNWIVCPVITIAQKAAEGLDSWIANTLNTNIDQTFGSSYYTAWNSFRILATAIIVIAGLIMVISQAMGFEALDAYTVRKTLPRLLVAVIGISLSWPLMKFVVEFFNAFGHDVYGLIVGPFMGIGGHVNLVTGGLVTLLAPVAGVAAFYVFGPAALLFILSGLLGLFMAFFILIIRQIAITVIIILAPIAIACYILPNTQKVWNIWKENFLGLMMMFPIVMAFIAGGHAFATVSMQHGGGLSTIIGIIAYFIPYFLLPMAFKLAMGAIGTIAGMVNDRSKGVFDRMKGVRQKAAEENMQAFKQGFSRTRLGSALAAGKHQSIARREAWGSGAVGIGKRGSARYRTALHNSELGHMAGVAAESIKNNPSAAANDDANKVAQFARDREDFIRRYIASKPGATRDEAINQLTYTEQAFGTSMGSAQMQHTAATAALASASSTDSTAERAAWMRHAVSQGIMTDSQAAALVKQSGSLVSSAGFGDLLGAANGTLSDADLLAKASDGFNPANSHRMRKGQAQELAKHMLERADTAASVHGVGSDEFAKAVADAAGIHDVMNGMTPDVREEFAKYLNGSTVGGKYMREHESTMESSSNGAYLDRRKTWASAAAAGGGAPGTMPGGGAPTGEK